MVVVVDDSHVAVVALIVVAVEHDEAVRVLDIRLANQLYHRLYIDFQHIVVAVHRLAIVVAVVVDVVFVVVDCRQLVIDFCPRMFISYKSHLSTHTDRALLESTSLSISCFHKSKK